MEVYYVKKKKEEEEPKTGFESITGYSKEASSKSTENTGEICRDKQALVLAMIKGMDEAQGYLKYINQVGFHFTDELAKEVSSQMVNINNSDHCWTPSQVKSEMAKLSLQIPSNVTLGDMTYLANMYYSDFYPNPLREPKDCIIAAHNIAKDPDGYPGMIFLRWTADLMAKSYDINWEDFI